MDMQTVKILGIVFSASLVHSLSPSHWLSFTLVGRQQQWTLNKTLMVAGVAGCLHVFSTVLLGIVVMMVGDRFFEVEEFEKVSALFLVGIGIVYVILHLVKREDEHDHEHVQQVPGRPAMISLFLMLTLSPCEYVIPTFFTAAKGGWELPAMMTAVMLVTTVGAMLVLIVISWRGMAKIKFHFIEHNERFLIGVILCLMGVALMLW